ncbi:MAG: hypothetical protein JNK81_09300 [Anaerolineales bacterium]|nr:hypothetical protein [Anaerolineales bacterium]
MNLRYIFLRFIRHFMPESVARYLLKRRWVIRPGLESSDPFAAVEQYVKTLSEHGKTIQGKGVLLFGYGGRFAVAVDLLRRGASHIVLCDHFVLLDHERNAQLLPDYEMYLKQNQDEVQPRSEFITLLHGDIRDESIQSQISQVDCILSTSVYEHLDDVNGITKALANLTSPQGFHLHFIDLRDHYFKYPFEMLKFSENVWKNFLNPTSNLNRFRLNDYQKVFETYFNKVHIAVISREEEAFRVAQPNIRPEFLTGDVSVDSIALIYTVTESPIQ